MNTKGKMMTKMMTQASKTSAVTGAIKGKAMTKGRKTSGRSTSFSKLKLLASGSLSAAAILLALAPEAAVAQAASPSGHAVNAEPVVISEGNFTVGFGSFIPGSTVDTVEINSDQVIIDWNLVDQPTGTGTINFLPSGNGLIFDRVNGGDYTVLNRIVPTDQTRGIGIDGNVSSLSAGNIAGNIWFYSPGGIIVGSGANFNIGSLLLTTNVIDVTGGLVDPNGTIRFRGPVGSTSSISIASGAQISALQDNSYVAMVAPRVVQGGTVNVNGSVGYVAAEQADITINNGLFDIAVTVGSESSTGIEHSGTTTGPTRVAPFGSADADNQTIYMVAVPKNQAMTMLLSGSIGYTPASGAILDSRDGSIVLSAGGNVTSTGSSNFIDETIDPARTANINITNMDFSSNVEAFANNDIVIEGLSDAPVSGAGDLNTLNLEFSSGGTIRMEANEGSEIGLDGNVTLNAVNGAQVIAGPNSAINVTGDLTVNAFSETQGGIIDILASGSGIREEGSGEIIIGNNLIVNAGIAGLPGSDASLENGVDTFGGTINLDIENGGLLDINRNGGTQNPLFSVSAAPIMGTVTAGESTGGTINVNITGTGSTLTNNGTSSLIFEARGNDGGNFFGLSTGGTNSGGTINFNVTGGIIDAASLRFDTGANATRNGSIDGAPNTGVSENGANAGAVTATFTDATLNIPGLLGFENVARSEDQYDIDENVTDGDVSAGNLTVTFDNSTLNGGSLDFGGNISGNGTAGDLFLNVINGSNLTLTSYLDFSARAYSGGLGASSGSGNINILVDNASINTQSYYLDASRDTQVPVDAPVGAGTGSVNVTVQNGGSLTGGILYASADATTDTQGGSVTAGDIAITIDGGSIILDDSSSSSSGMFLSATGSGYGNIDDAASTERGLGVGGNITVTLDNEGIFSVGPFSSDTSGQIRNSSEGPIPISGQGGSGIGGTTTFNLNSGDFTVGAMSVTSDGYGSFGGDSFSSFSQQPSEVGDGGNGQGGEIIFNVGGADVAASNLVVSASGFGGDGGTASDIEAVDAGNAGIGTGGSAIFNVTAGGLTVSDSFTVNSDGTGGRGGDGFGVNAGSGGDAVGGNAGFNLDGAATLSAPSVTISAGAVGGRGGDAQSGFSNSITPPQRTGDGGNAVAGTAAFANTGGDIISSSVFVTAAGTGGDAGNDPEGPDRQPDPFGDPIPAIGYTGQIAGNGGSGTGGNATITLGQDSATNPLYQVVADGIGAKGGGGTSGGIAGDGDGGTAVLNITNAALSLDSPLISAEGRGGDGGIANDVSGNGGNGGSGLGGVAMLEITGADTDLTFTGDGLIMSGDGLGGNGADGAGNSGGSGGNGGDGGDAIGGTAQIAVRGGANFALADGFTLSSNGFGGSGGTGGSGGAVASTFSGDGGNGGQGTGGGVRLLAQGGTITGGDASLVALGQGGSAGFAGALESDDGTSGSDGIGGTGAGGATFLEVQEGSPGIITLGNVEMIANGLNAGDDAIPTGLGGRIEIIDTSTDPAGLITLASLDAEALAGAGSASGFFMSGNSGTTNVTGNFTVDVAGDVVFAFDGDGQLNVGGSTSIDTPQNFIVTHTNRPTGLDSIISGGDFIANIGGNIDATGSALRSASALDFTAGGSIGFGDIYAGDDANLLASGGDITGDLVSGNTGITISSPGIVTIGSLVTQSAFVNVTGDQGIELQTLTGGSANLTASEGDVAVRENADLTGGVSATGLNVFLRSTGDLGGNVDATDGNIDIESAGDLLTYGLEATGNILLSSTGGSVRIDETPAIAGGDINVTAATDAIIATGAEAGNNLSITAGNLIDIQGLTTGTTIDLASADINIGADGQLGELFRTTDITIESNGVNQAVLGGTASTGTFNLTEEEFGRIQANDSLTVFVQATGADTPDLVIQDLTIGTLSDTGSGQVATLGLGGTLNINSGQSIRVDGDLNLTNAAPETSLNITAANDIRINNDGGVIQITDANNGFGSVGILSLAAQNIYAMTDQAMNDIIDVPLEDIDLRLGDSDGIDLDAGVIRAGSAQFFAEGNMFIQNTAPDDGFDARRGFSVGSLTIYGSSSGSETNIVINGVVDGVTGSDTIAATGIEAQYDPASTINGCLISDPASCGAPTPTPTPTPTPEIPVIDPVQDVIEQEVTSGDTGSSINDPLQNNVIEIKEVDEFINDPLINDPVTGAGNDDLWVGGNGPETNGDNSECEGDAAECGQDGSPE